MMGQLFQIKIIVVYIFRSKACSLFIFLFNLRPSALLGHTGTLAVNNSSPEPSDFNCPVLSFLEAGTRCSPFFGVCLRRSRR